MKRGENLKELAKDSQRQSACAKKNPHRRKFNPVGPKAPRRPA
ncbi:MAG: hypothetical protein Q8Q73_19110 [Stagnimonas sp.]|nr:hypothetical protein [Stagnimonas sp.]